MKLKKGKGIRVKKDFFDFESPNTNLIGWTGIITNVDKDEETFEVDWDLNTIEKMPDQYILDAELEGLSIKTYIFLFENTDLLEEFETPIDKEAIKLLVGKRIDEVFQKDYLRLSNMVGIEDLEDEKAAYTAWYKALKKDLTFPVPFFAHFVSSQTTGEWVMIGDISKIPNKEHGLMLVGIYQGQLHQIPLLDGFFEDEYTEAHPILKDFLHWYSHRLWLKDKI